MGDGPRVLRPDRAQLRWDMVDLDSLLEPDHLARAVVAFVASLDLSQFYDRIRSRDAVAGRPTPDPSMVLSLWLYATAEGVGSARLLDELCRSHVAYRWICGGVPVNYHGLSAFRSGLEEAFLDDLLRLSVASLAAEGLIDLEGDLAVDGTKLKANAGRSSYRTREGLAAYEAAVARRLARLKAEAGTDPAAGRRRREATIAAKEADRQARVASAKARLNELESEKAARAKSHKKEEAAKSEPKISTTDPEARLMKMADGAVRPAWNIVVAALPESQVICAITATDRRNDSGLARPMVEAFEARYGFRPARLLVDSRMATQEDITRLAGHETYPVAVYSPLPQEKDESELKPASRRARASKRRRESEALREWRGRMATEQGKAVYARRKLIELTNAHLKNPGWTKTMLRGLRKVNLEARLHALAHNLKRAFTLRRQAAPA